MRLASITFFLFTIISSFITFEDAFSQLNPHFCKDSGLVGRLNYSCSVNSKCSEVTKQLDKIDSFISPTSLKDIKQKCNVNCAKNEKCAKNTSCKKSCQQSCIWDTLSQPLMSAITAYHSDCTTSLKISKCATKEAKPYCNLMSLKDDASKSYRPKSNRDYKKIKNIYTKTSKKYRLRCDEISNEVKSVSEEVRAAINGELNCQVLDVNYKVCSDVGLAAVAKESGIKTLGTSLAPQYQHLVAQTCQPTPTPAPQVGLGCKQATSCSQQRDDVMYTDLDGKTCFCDQVCCTQFSDCCSNFANECSVATGGNICNMNSTSDASLKSVNNRSRF